MATPSIKPATKLINSLCMALCGSDAWPREATPPTTRPRTLECLIDSQSCRWYVRIFRGKQ